MWLLWFGAAVIFFIIEMINLTFYVICLGIGALAASAMALILPKEEYIWAQLATFAVVTFLSFVVLQPFSRYLKKKGKRYRTNIESIYDDIGIVTREIGPNAQEGRIAIRGSSWRAVAMDNQIIAPGERVRVHKIDGTKLYVSAIKENPEKIS